MNQVLLTNSERKRRHMVNCDLCPICGGESETLMHVFRDCNRIKSLWNCTKIPNSRDFYSNTNWCLWLTENICRFREIDRMNWAITFGVILDTIWRARNDFVFNNVGTSFDVILHRAQWMARSSTATTSLFRNLNPLFRNSIDLPLVGWISPLPGVIKLNVDASVSDAGFRAGCGGVVRNNAGEFLYGFVRKIHPCTVVEAELWAIFHGLNLVVGRGEMEVVIESDSQEAIDALSSRANPQNHLSSIIDDINGIISGSCNVRWSKVPREFNKVADVLAKYSLSISSHFEVYDIAPHFIHSLILEDKMGRLYL